MNNNIGNSVSRRALLNLAIRSAAGAGILGGGLRSSMAAFEQSVPSPRTRHEMRDYTAETFLPHVGRIITFEAPKEGDIPAHPVSFRLLEVLRPNNGSRPEGFREPFSLLFALTDGQPAARALHRIVHEDFAPSEWLLSRVFVPGRDARVAYHEAVFG